MNHTRTCGPLVPATTTFARPVIRFVREARSAPCAARREATSAMAAVQGTCSAARAGHDATLTWACGPVWPAPLLPSPGSRTRFGYVLEELASHWEASRKSALRERKSPRPPRAITQSSRIPTRCGIG
ncbi:hypothetical protein GCM10010214_61900 [Streptomyces abikoensis]|nr:hypothetical protein GCM10010214_61900 [Streptomyces abikoensis]